MNLFEIDKRLDEIWNTAVDIETGVVDATVTDEILQLFKERDQKIEQFALWHKNCTAEADAIAKEIKTLQEREKRLRSKTKWIDSVLDFTLNGQRFESPKVQIGYRKSTVVEIDDYEEFINQYRDTDMVREKVEVMPNKEEIKKRLKDGKEIKGAYLMEHQNMQIK